MLSLELMSFDVAPQQDLYTKQGVAVTVEAVAQIKVKSDPESIQTAAEQFLTKTPQEREGLIRLVMEGHLRGIIGQLTVEEIVKQPEMVADRMRATCADDMNKMGLEVVSFTIKEVRDKNEYITNMGRPDVATNQARRRRGRRRSRARHGDQARRSDARGGRRQGPGRSGTRARRNRFRKQPSRGPARSRDEAGEYLRNRAEAAGHADKAYEIQTNIMQQQVIAEQVKIEQVQKTGQIKVQDAEIQRRERELIATDTQAGGGRTAQDRDTGRSAEAENDYSKPMAKLLLPERRAKRKPRSFSKRVRPKPRP